MNGKDLTTFLTEKITERGWSLRKVSEVTGISLGHLEHLLRGEFDELPASPYLHGYLTKLGEALNFDPEPWWRAIRASAASDIVARSGLGDTLPTNRFARVRAGKWAWLAIVLLIIVVYGALRFQSIFGLPTVTVLVPETDTISTTSQSVTLRGTLINGTDIKINGEPVPLADDSSWQKDVILSQGVNTFEFTAEKFLGRSRTVIRQVVYMPASTSTPETPGNPDQPHLPEEDPIDIPVDDPEEPTSTIGTTTTRAPQHTTVIF